MMLTSRYQGILGAIFGVGSMALCVLAFAMVAGPAGASTSNGVTAAASTSNCTPGAIQLLPTIEGTPYNHVLVGTTSWSFGWERTQGCDPLEYRMHENLLATTAPGGNASAARTVDYTLTTASPSSGTDTMGLLDAGVVGGTFYGCEQLDIAVLNGKKWEHRWGGIVVAPGAGPHCAPVKAVLEPTASVLASCGGNGSYRLVNPGADPVTFEVAENGSATSVSVAAGAVVLQTFSGATAGSRVTVTAAGETLAAVRADTQECDPTTSTTEPGAPPTTIGPKIVTDLVGPEPGSHAWGLSALALALAALMLLLACGLAGLRLAAAARR
jgi:hypothetical protein